MQHQDTIHKKTNSVRPYIPLAVPCTGKSLEVLVGSIHNAVHEPGIAVAVERTRAKIRGYEPNAQTMFIPIASSLERRQWQHSIEADESLRDVLMSPFQCGFHFCQESRRLMSSFTIATLTVTNKNKSKMSRTCDWVRVDTSDHLAEVVCSNQDSHELPVILQYQTKFEKAIST